MIEIKKIICNELAVNTYVLYDETRNCLIIDPGFMNKGQFYELQGYLTNESLNPACIINTHGHFDHIAGNTFVRMAFGCPVWMHREDLFLVDKAEEQAAMFGFRIEKQPDPDRYLADDERIEFGNSTMLILHVPGHSPGSICLYSASDKFLVCGDVLFQGSVGRSDLIRGNHDVLITHIRNKLMVLPRDTVVYPGHGPSTAIGQEYDTNPFLK